MAFDGIITKSVIKELQNLINYKIDKVFEPDKNTIVLGLYGKGKNFNLLISISSTNYRIHLTNHQQKNPISAPSFCMLLRKYLIGMKIGQIYSIDLERVIFIDLENNENPDKPIKRKLIVELMGKHSNIILTDESEIIIDSMRHTFIDKNASRDIYPTSRYKFLESSKYSFLKLKNFDDFYSKIEPSLTDILIQNTQNIEDLSISNFELDKILANTFNGISSNFIKNIISKLQITTLSKSSLNEIYNKIKEIIEFNNLEVIFSENNKDYFLYTNSNIDENPFNINFLLDDFYYSKESEELFKNYRNGILNFILATLKKYEKRLINIDKKLDECKDMEKYRIYGELITANLYQIQNYNLENIELENYYDNNNHIIIPLNNKYLPSYNAKLYFKKYNKLKNALNVVTVQKQETIDDINYIESVIYELNTCKTVEDVEEIYEEISENTIFENKLKTKKKSKKSKAKLLTQNKEAKFNPLKYVIDGYTILVGRNNKENDYLTCKFARKNDIWFHTKDTHGSHVILKTNDETIIPEEILFEAAKLAVKHSKAKNSSHTPVDYCRVSNVKKPNGSKPRICDLY